MHAQSLLVVLAALFAASIAVPLNINLGAYSPALVVGDGSLSFKDGAVTTTPKAAPAAQVPAANGEVPTATNTTAPSSAAAPAAV
jgi:hypothetical protein